MQITFDFISSYEALKKHISSCVRQQKLCENGSKRIVSVRPSHPKASFALISGKVKVFLSNLQKLLNYVIYYNHCCAITRETLFCCEV